MASLDEGYISQSTEQFTTPPQTPPDLQPHIVKIIHPWPEPETEPEYRGSVKRRKTSSTKHKEIIPTEAFDVLHQEVLLLHAPKQRYAHTKKQQIPSLENEREMLIAVEVVGLNPIDWKAPYEHVSEANPAVTDLLIEISDLDCQNYRASVDEILLERW